MSPCRKSGWSSTTTILIDSGRAHFGFATGPVVSPAVEPQQVVGAERDDVAGAVAALPGHRSERGRVPGAVGEVTRHPRTRDPQDAALPPPYRAAVRSPDERGGTRYRRADRYDRRVPVGGAAGVYGAPHRALGRPVLVVQPGLWQRPVVVEHQAGRTRFTGDDAGTQPQPASAGVARRRP